MTNNITFHWLKTLKNKKIRVNNDIEGYFMGASINCGTMNKIKIVVNDISITLATREKSQIEVISN